MKGAAGLSLGAIISACSSGSKKANSITPTSGSGGSAGLSNATLSVGLAAAPTTLDPLGTGPTGNANGYYNIFDYLYFRDQAGNTVPHLATGYTVSSDGLAYTFTLRQGVTWHNGDAFTANDVVFSYERANNPAINKNYLGLHLAGVDLIDQNTVRVRLTQPNADFITSTTGIVAMMPQNYITQKGDAYFAQNPIGCGPFSVASYTLNQSLVLNRFDNYWGTKAGYKTVNFSFIADSTTRVNALRSGQVDLIDGLQPSNVGSLNGFTVKSAATGEVFTFCFNLALQPNAPYQNQQVRQAIDYAIDKQSIITNLLQGYAVPAVAGLYQGQLGYAESGLTPRAYDPKMAKQLLATAGYANGFNMNVIGVANGRFLSSGDVTQAVSGYLNDVGIKTNTQVLPVDQWLTQIQKQTDFGVGMVFEGGTSGSFLNEVQGVAIPGQLYSHGNDNHITTLYNAINAATNHNDYVAAIVACAKYIDDQASFVSLYSDKAIWGMKSSVSYEPWQSLSGVTPLVNAKPA